MSDLAPGTHPSAEQIELDFAHISGIGVDGHDLVEINQDDMEQLLKARRHWAEMGKQSGGFDHTIKRDYVLIENAQPFRGNYRRHVCCIKYGETWLVEGIAR